MTIVRLAFRAAVLASVLATTSLFARASHAEDRAAATQTVAPKDVQTKLAYCEVCHGVAAQGFRGYYPIPRLAGQQVEYLQNQLQAFIEHRRTNNIMFNVGHVLSWAMIAALTDDFRDLNPKPLGGAPKVLSTPARKSSLRELRTQIFRLALRVTARMPKAMGRFRVSPDSFMII